MAENVDYKIIERFAKAKNVPVLAKIVLQNGLSLSEIRWHLEHMNENMDFSEILLDVADHMVSLFNSENIENNKGIL